MKRIKRNIILSLFLILTFQLQGFSNEDSLLIPSSEVNVDNTIKSNSNYFNLANIVDSFLSNDSQTTDEFIDDKSKIRKEFIAITSKFNQGNAKVAYDEYERLIAKIDNDTSLLTLAKILYEIGYFSLANKAVEKIVYKNQFYDNILDLEKSYKPKTQMTKEEEIFFAKQYSSIYFDNSAREALSDLTSKKVENPKNDYNNFMLARAYFETKQYSQALGLINKTILLNPNNINYQIFKIDILMAMNKQKEALKLAKKLQKNKLTINFIDDIEIKKQVILSNITKNNNERKYHIVNKTFLEGNFEKSKRDCQNILNFDKDNDKIAALYAKSELALGNIQRANSYYVNAYKLNKKNNETLVGLGDIRYLHGDYRNSLKIYKKAYKNDKKNYEILIKMALAHRQNAKHPKELRKLEIALDKMPKKEYLAYYKSAISVAQKNNVLKEEYLKRTLTVNPMYENALGELVELYLKNKNYKTAKSLIYNASFTLEKNYYYYYLCGLYNQALGKRKEAIQFYKTSLNLNPSFEIANVRLIKLIPESSDEEI